ncbi:NfeD family protein [Haladaptatus sp. CMAA 1911]|uniref:NfeD family protein n=1 Tax=unclassified Haladaptatus TaxID=2622732 RepID=UPI003754004C
MASPFDSLALLLVLAGAALAFAEALIPGAHFIVLGIALLLTGLLALVFPPLAQPFVLAFLVLAFGGLAFYGYRHLDIYGGKGSGRTKDSDSLKGTTGHVTERVTRSGGQVKLDGGGFSPYFAARSMDGEIPEGTEVMVIDPGGGNVVTVEPIDFIEDAIDRELARERADTEGTNADRTNAERETEEL